jgi:hypothetical protein
MNQTNFVRSLTRTSALASLMMLGSMGCSAAADVSDEQLGSNEQALAACSSQTLGVASATASSVENNYFVASWAVDQNQSTRWSSGQGAPQWLKLDLGSRRFISTLKIDWQTAFSPNYDIQVSDDGVSFASVRKVVTSSGGHQEITGLDVDARYVRIYANQVSSYGSVSILEVAVVGSPDPVCSTQPASCGDSVRLPPVATQASSTEFSYTPASAGADDVYSTRWSSSWSDNQWLAFDLGSVARVDQLRITWQAAYARSYAIETATSFAGPWTQAKLVTNGAGGVETVPVGANTRFLRLKGITRATGYGISVWDVTVLGSKDAACGDNLLTRGWDPNAVLDVACPNGGGCGATYSLNSAQPNVINFVGGYFCPVNSHPSSLTFTQAVTSPTAGTKFHLSLNIANYSGYTGYGGCAQWGNTTFLVSLGGTAASSYSPAAGYIPAPITGCVAGSGTLDVDIDVPFAAGETKNLTFGMTPISFAAGSTGCGSYAESFNVTNVKLVKVQ